MNSSLLFGSKVLFGIHVGDNLSGDIFVLNVVRKKEEEKKAKTPPNAVTIPVPLVTPPRFPLHC